MSKALGTQRRWRGVSRALVVPAPLRPVRFARASPARGARVKEVAERLNTPNRSKEPCAFWISPDQKAALRAIKERDGIPVSEQIRRAIDQWLGEKAPEKCG